MGVAPEMNKPALDAPRPRLQMLIHLHVILTDLWSVFSETEYRSCSEDGELTGFNEKSSQKSKLPKPLRYEGTEGNKSSAICLHQRQTIPIL